MKKTNFLWIALALLFVLVVVGCKTDEDSDPVQFKLTVTNLPVPNDGYGWGASLMTEDDGPVASGSLLQSNTCIFYVIGENNVPSSNLFNKDGLYTVAISQASLSTFEPDLSTVKIAALPVLFDADDPNKTIDFEDFLEQMN